MRTGAPPVAARRRWRGHALGVLWVLGAGAALLGPALAHGSSLGPIDWLSQYGLSARHGVVVNNRQTFDQVTELIPWSTLGWAQVHAGHLPLWNPHSGLGMPLAFNWQSASFSLPALVGYLLPQHLAYSVQVIAAVVIAGTGAYVFAAVIGVGPVGCAAAGSVFELCGPMVGWIGWPVAWVMAWAGWVFAAVVLVLRGRRRARAIVVMALAVAAAVYAGQPDTLVLLAMGTVVFVAAALALRAPALGGTGPVLRPLGDTLIAAAIGVALAAPVLLPGIELARMSVRSGKGESQILAAGSSIHLLVQGFDGLPVVGSRWFGSGFYVRTAAYLGVVGLALAVVGVGSTVRAVTRQSNIVAIAVVAVAAAAAVFVPVVLSALEALPGVGSITWNRALLVLGFALAMLAGVGADVLTRRFDEPVVRRWAWGTLLGLGAVLGLVWLVGRGSLPGAQASLRARSFLWPAVATGSALAVMAAARLLSRRRPPGHGAASNRAGPGPWVGAAMLVIETSLLVGAGAPLMTSSPTPLTPTAAERALAHTVGSGLVGLGSNACFTPAQLGEVPDVNAAFSLDEMAVYDPMLPTAYYASWLQATGTTGAGQARPAVPFSLFCPAITTASIARRYGVSYVLEPAGTPGPAGTRRVATVADEDVYRVPGSARATVVAWQGAGWPGEDAPGTPVSVTQPDPSTWVVHTRTSAASVLRLRLTDVPGWRATVDGRATPLVPFSGVMLQLRVPAGAHRVELSYAPAAFRAGLLAAGAGVLAVAGVGVGAVVARRRTRASRRELTTSG